MKWHKYFWHKTLKRPFKLSRTIDHGRGQILLLIHGLGGSGVAWTPLADQVDLKNWHIVAFDLLGFGSSPKPDWGKYDVQEHAAAVIASLRRFEKSRPIVIVAHSMGCLVASHIAALRPELIDRLVLYEPPLFADDPQFRSHKRRKKLYFAIYRTIANRPALVLVYSRLAANFVNSVYAYTVNKETWTAFEKSLHNTIMAQKAYTELKNIMVPTDIIHGRLDFVVTRTEVKKMLLANPNIDYHTVTEMHGISKKAARYIIRLLEKPPEPRIQPAP